MSNTHTYEDVLFYLEFRLHRIRGKAEDLYHNVVWKLIIGQYPDEPEYPLPHMSEAYTYMTQNNQYKITI